MRDLERAMSSLMSSRSRYLKVTQLTKTSFHKLAPNDKAHSARLIDGSLDAYLLTGRLGFSDDSDEFFIIENPSSVVKDAALPARARSFVANIINFCRTINFGEAEGEYKCYQREIAWCASTGHH